MTVHETAMRLIRQRGTACSDPAFIAAYLQQELNQARARAIAYVERFLADTTPKERAGMRAAIEEARRAH